MLCREMVLSREPKAKWGREWEKATQVIQFMCGDSSVPMEFSILYDIFCVSSFNYY